jgi:uncharacterized protein YndB with AHSA1/START domain/catechol 2,3-dioxygenase-like lactoylglutathione lyase family enzyme
MEFIVNKETKTVVINAEFDAERDLVWDAYTKPELLDQWWAPKPFMSRTKVMDFREGGRRFYAMVSPEGKERWAIQQYRSITPKTTFKLFNAFADENENPELPGSDWDLSFTEDGGRTTVSISIYNESLERLERMIEMGFKEGTGATFETLKELLARMERTEIGSASPLFIVRSVPETLAFYRDKLGFDVTFEGPVPDDIFFGIVQRGRAMIMFKAIDVEPVPNYTRDIGHGIAAWDAYVYVPDPDSLYEEFASRDVEFSRPLENNHDNLRGFELRDPNGYNLFFGCPCS